VSHPTKLVWGSCQAPGPRVAHRDIKYVGQYSLISIMFAQKKLLIPTLTKTKINHEFWKKPVTSLMTYQIYGSNPLWPITTIFGAVALPTPHRPRAPIGVNEKVRVSESVLFGGRLFQFQWHVCERPIKRRAVGGLSVDPLGRSGFALQTNERRLLQSGANTAPDCAAGSRSPVWGRGWMRQIALLGG